MRNPELDEAQAGIKIVGRNINNLRYAVDTTLMAESEELSCKDPLDESESCCCCQVSSVMSNSVRPHRRQPTRLPHAWDSPGKNTGVGCHCLLQCVKVKSELVVSDS